MAVWIDRQTDGRRMPELIDVRLFDGLLDLWIY